MMATVNQLSVNIDIFSFSIVYSSYRFVLIKILLTLMNEVLMSKEKELSPISNNCIHFKYSSINKRGFQYPESKSFQNSVSILDIIPR